MGMLFEWFKFWINEAKKKFLCILGDIKVFKYPLFVVYDPGSYLVKGANIRKAVELLQPGDIILRRYIHYLDGYFIPRKIFSYPEYMSGDGKVIHAISERCFRN